MDRPAGAGCIEVGAFEVEVNQALAPIDVEAAVRLVTDPGLAEETLHWGRNYLFTTTLETVAGPLEVVVKQFRHQGLVARTRRRLSGGKATKSWRVAEFLAAAGVPTPDPVLLVEAKAAEGASFLVTRRLRDVVESRYFFRALAAGVERQQFPGIDRIELMAALGRLCSRLHAAGVWHRDISIGNLLVRSRPGSAAPEVFILDLNRAQLGRRMGLVRRTRDLCRMPILAPADRQAMLSAYWGEAVERSSFRYFLLALFARAFLLRNRLKDLTRRPVRAATRLIRGRRAYTHIPPAPPGAAPRDKAVWDHLSDQPHQHASRAERARARLADLGAHAEAAAALARAAPAAWRRYRRLATERFAAPRDWPGVGIALRPWPEAPEKVLEAVAETSVRRVLLRLHPWQSEHSAELALAGELAARGYEVTFALPQNRELVKDLPRWRAAVEQLADTFRPFGRHFQIGHAINRSKWGVWTYREYLDLVAVASEVLRRTPEMLVLGPAVIDFELQATAAVLNMRREGVHFDVVTSLLYVDRRGAPENLQLGFDSVGKATLLRAIAETAGSSGPECWITEVNWPLREGPHAPAGRDVAVDEETQADYLVRYCVQMLCCGMIERVYWWQLVARGYGLTVEDADGTLRRRPAHRALATLERQLAGARFAERLTAPPGTWLLRFCGAERDDRLIGWSNAGPARLALSRPPVAVVDRDGGELAPPGGPEVVLGCRPLYFHLGPER